MIEKKINPITPSQRQTFLLKKNNLTKTFKIKNLIKMKDDNTDKLQKCEYNPESNKNIEEYQENSIIIFIRILKLFIKNEIIFTLKDTKNINYYRLTEEGHFIWNLLNGRHTIRDISLAFHNEYDVFDPGMVSMQWRS